MDNGEPGLSDSLDQCVSVASDLAARSSTDAVIADQTRVLADVAATCSSMAAAVASGDTVALTDGRVVLESQFEGLADLVDAFEELMYHGDSNEPVDSIADQ